MALFVPPRVARELELESRGGEPSAMRVLVGDHQYQWKREFDAQLERVMPGMKLVMCPDPAPMDAVAQGAIPGCWHLAWPGFAGGPLSVQPLVLGFDGEPRIGGDGVFIEPGSWVFDKLAEADLWDDRVMRERRRIKREAEEAKARRRERELADFDQDCLERWLAVSRTQVSMNRSTPWAQNATGLRRTKGESRRRDG